MSKPPRTEQMQHWVVRNQISRYCPARCLACNGTVRSSVEYGVSDDGTYWYWCSECLLLMTIPTADLLSDEERKLLGLNSAARAA
ncbi:MAG: hypothetical protein ACYTJ0_12660 [Planctomycetota bacterium]